MSRFIIPYEGFWINDWISRRAELTPDWLALVDDADGERRVTFSQFVERVKHLSACLKEEMAIGKGDVVAILSWPRIEVLDVLFACMQLGAVFAPINTRYSPREINEFLNEIKPKVLFFETDFMETVNKVLESFSIENTVIIGETVGTSFEKYDDCLNYPRKLGKPAEVGLEDPVMIFQTGGTTGKPKSAFLTHRTILWNAVNTVRDLIVPGDTTITALPLFHIGGFTYTIPLLFWGGTNILMRRWDIEKFLDLVERERPTFLFLVPTQLKMLIESKRFWETDFNSVRWITSGGAALTPELIKAIMKKGVTQKQGYGLTEMGPGVFALDPWDARKKMGSIGKPNLLVEVKVLKENGEEADVNEPGIMLLRGPSLFGGYWNKPDVTEKTFRDGWLDTGDAVRKDEDGYYWVLGREKNIIKSGAESVFPEEIEKILLDHPKILNVVVIGVPDEKWGEVPKAVIKLKNGEKISKEEIFEYLKDKLAKYKWPKYIEVVEDIPVSPVGKVSRKEIRKLFGEPKDRF
ncbi:MAG: AMP-binding protein [Candidatus Njordarchaeia archaeon]